MAFIQKLKNKTKQFNNLNTTDVITNSKKLKISVLISYQFKNLTEHFL